MRVVTTAGRANSVLIAMAVAAIPCLAQAQDAPPPGAPPLEVAPPPEVPLPAVPPPPEVVVPSEATPPPSTEPPPPAAYAQPSPPQPALPGGHAHDGLRLYLRLHAGIGLMHITDGDPGGQTFDGASASAGAALGVMVVRDLAVFGTLFASYANDPDWSLRGSPAGTLDGSTTLWGFGAGVVSYFEWMNVYVSAAIAGTHFDLEDRPREPPVAGTRQGLGFQAIVGKEWWVSPSWGLGVAGELIGAFRMQDNNDQTVHWRGGALSLLFSSTYN